jgi:hypothetical protein
MSAAPHAFATTRPGANRILEHCSSLDRVLEDDGMSALARLEGELGSDLTQHLVGALTGRYGRSPSCFAV